jgi:hypothetical protein
MEQSEILMQFVQNSPEQLSMFGDLLFKMQDYPLAAEISERFEKMLPPGIKPAKEGELPPEIQQMLAEIEQQKEQLEQKAQALNEAEYEINEIRTKVGKATVEAMGKEERVKVELGRVEVLKQELGLMEREMKLQNPNADADAKIKIAAMQQETQYVLGVMEGELKEKSELLKIQQDSMKETKQIDTSKLETQIAALEKKIAMQDNSKNDMNPMAETMSGIKDILAQMQKPKKIKKNLKAGVNKLD